MSENLPKYMNIQDFCAYSGFSRFQFMRLADKANLTIRALSSDRRSRMVDVQEALAAIENLPEADREMPVNPPAQEAASQAAE